MTEKCFWIDDGETGAPTEDDWNWFTQHVASLNYPRIHKNPIIDGQLDIITYLANESLDADRD